MTSQIVGRGPGGTTRNQPRVAAPGLVVDPRGSSFAEWILPIKPREFSEVPIRGIEACPMFNSQCCQMRIHHQRPGDRMICDQTT